MLVHSEPYPRLVYCLSYINQTWTQGSSGFGERVHVKSAMMCTEGVHLTGEYTYMVRKGLYWPWQFESRRCHIVGIIIIVSYAGPSNPSEVELIRGTPMELVVYVVLDTPLSRST